MTYLRPSKAEFATWKAVGNEDWSWDSLLPYFKKSERLQIPSKSQEDQGATYKADFHGFQGLIDIGWPPALDVSRFGSALNQTWQSFGLPWNRDPNAGLPRGLFLKPSFYDLDHKAVREDADRAYIAPVENRANLRIFTNTAVLNVEIDCYANSSSVVATGVITEGADGKKVIKATREVILSEGTLRNPGLLEVSGIGNPR